MTFQTVEVAIPRRLFATILRRIIRLCRHPVKLWTQKRQLRHRMGKK